MPSSVDNRVVSMKFDNHSFEQNIAESIASLAHLKNAMDFSSVGPGLGEISAQADKFSLAGIADEVSNISDKFGVMGAVGFSAISNLVGTAIDAGKKMAGALVNPIVAGGKERAMNIEQAKFQFRGLGIDVDKAMKSALDAVRGTAFGLGDAAKAAAQLGASGIDAGDKMTSVLRAIAGTAAMTGSSFGEMSQIFTSSAALNKVSNQDLDQFATRGLNASAALGKVLGKTEAQIREMATNGEIDFKTFSDGMDKAFGEHATKANETYAGSLANMHAALGRLGASFFSLNDENLRQIFNGLSPVIDSVAASLQPLINTFEFFFALFKNNLVDRMKNLNFDKFSFAIKIFSDALAHLFSILTQVGGMIGHTFKDAFPTGFSDLIVKIAVGFHKLVDVLQPNNFHTLVKIDMIFRGIFDAIAIGMEIIKQIAWQFRILFKTFEQANGGKLLNFFSTVADKLTMLRYALVEGGGIEEFFMKFVDPVSRFIANIDFGGAIDLLVSGFTALKDAVQGIFGGGSDKISAGADVMAAAAQRVSDRWGWLINVGHKLADFGHWLIDVFQKVADVIHDIFGKIIDAFTGADSDQILAMLNTGIFALLTTSVTKFVNSGIRVDATGGLFPKLSRGLTQITNNFEAMQMVLKAEALQKIGIAIGIVAASILVLSLIDPPKVTAALAAMAAGFAELVAVMKALDKLISGPTDAAKLAIISAALLGVAGAMLVMSIAIKILSTINPDDMQTAVLAIGAVLAEITAALKNLDGPSMVQASAGILLIAGAMLILSISLKILATIDPKDMAKGLGGIATFLAEVVVALKNMDGPEMMSAAASLVLVSAAMVGLSIALQILARMNPEEMANGLMAIGVFLTEVVVALKNMDGPSMLAAGAALLIISGAMVVMATAIQILGAMDLQSMIQGITGIAATMLILVVAANAMVEALPGAAAILVMSGALVVLGIAVMAFANIGFGNLVAGLIGVAAVFIVLGIATAALTPLIPEMFLLGLAMVALGAGFALFGVAAAGVGVLLFSIAKVIEVLANTAVDAVKGVIEGFRLLALALPDIVKGIVAAVLAFITGLLDGIPEILTMLTTVIDAIIQLLVTEIPKFAIVMTTLIQTMAATIQLNLPTLIQMGIFIIESLLQGISDSIEMITNQAVDILTKFMDTLASRAGDLTASGANLIVSMLNGIANNIQSVVDAGFNLITKLLEGINSNVGSLVIKATDIIVTIIQGIDNSLWRIIDAGGNLIIHFIQGLASKSLQVTNAALDTIITFVNGLADAIRTHSAELNDAGWNLASAIIDGMTGGLASKAGEVVDKAKSIAGDVIGAFGKAWEIFSPSKVMHRMGGFLMDGVANGMEDNTSAVTSAETMADKVTSTINDTFNQMVASLGTMDEFNPTITPVLDLTSVEAEAKRLSGMLATDTSFNAAASIVAATRQNGSDPVTTDTPPVAQEVTYVQNNYSPEALSTGDIYKQTKSQIALASGKVN